MLKFQRHVQLNAVIVEPVFGYEFCDLLGGDQDGWELRRGAIVDESLERCDSRAAEASAAEDDAVRWHLFVWLEVLKSLEAASWIGRDQHSVTDFFQSVTKRILDL